MMASQHLLCLQASTLFITLLASFSTWAQTPPILLEACNAMEPAAKRLECLRAANGMAPPTGSNRSAAPLALHAPSTSKPVAAVSPALGSSHAIGGKTCYVGPRGGTYTITASGRKNYSGC